MAEAPPAHERDCDCLGRPFLDDDEAQRLEALVPDELRRLAWYADERAWGAVVEAFDRGAEELLGRHDPAEMGEILGNPNLEALALASLRDPAAVERVKPRRPEPRPPKREPYPWPYLERVYLNAFNRVVAAPTAEERQLEFREAARALHRFQGLELSPEQVDCMLYEIGRRAGFGALDGTMLLADLDASNRRAWP